MFNQKIREMATIVKDLIPATQIQKATLTIPLLQQKHNEPIDIVRELADQLGLSNEQAAALFYAYNIYII